MPNGWWYMPPEPVPVEPEWDDDPAWSRPDPMTAEQRQAWLDWVCEHEEPPEPEECEDSGNAALGGRELPPAGTGFSFTPVSRDGPPGGYGTWRLRTPGFPAAPSPGPLPPAGPTPPSPPGTPFEYTRGTKPPKNARQPSGSGRAASGASGP
jgi:hypothetical protein